MDHRIYDNLNPDLGYRVLANLIEEYHDQAVWFHLYDGINGIFGSLKKNGDIPCGTTMCLAGWTAYEAGYTLDSADESATKPGEERRSINRVARDLLIGPRENWGTPDDLALITTSDEMGEYRWWLDKLDEVFNSSREDVALDRFRELLDSMRDHQNRD